MIVYQLVCEHDHTFESWFRDSAAYDHMAAAGELVCPVCGTSKVSKAVMAPRLGRRKGADDDPVTRSSGPGGMQAVDPVTAAKQALVDKKMAEFLRELRGHVEKTCDYVGDRFAEEARKIHYGEVEARGIYGEASVEEARDLQDEGVAFSAIPWGRRDA